MLQNEENTNPYLAEAKRLGFSPEQMARGAEMVERIMLHYDTMLNAERKLAKVIAWAAHADTVDKEELQLLGVILLSMQDYSNFKPTEPFAEMAVN